MAIERVLLETGDVLLLETGDDLLLESSSATILPQVLAEGLFVGDGAVSA